MERPRLIEQLNAGLHRKLTLVSAPAGFGKTTLVSEWIHTLGAFRETPLQTAWLSLDESDNDPTRFLTYLIAAVQTVEADIGKGVLGALQTPQPPPTEAILTVLINELAGIPEHIILVLDDYHLIEAQPVHDALAFLLRRLPPQMHLVIATRDDPPLSLARLRARGHMTELRAVDLRFTSSEAAEFLNQMMGLDLSAEDIAALETRTEGWIAGLQLAGISIQGSKDTSSFINSFTGSHRFVLDYLIEEVLEQQSVDVQTFLLQTAILDRMTGSLCNALTGQDNGQATLEALERANLFIIPLDEERRWYRYHHLFADLLRQRMRQTQPDWVPTLHLRASEWYEQNGFVDDAIEHALRVDDFERASSLIKEVVDDFWGQVDHARLRRWLLRLPIELVLSKPHLSIFHAWYSFVTGQQDVVKHCLHAAEQALEASTDHVTETKLQEQEMLSSTERVKLRGRLAAIRMYMDSHRGDVPGIIQHAHQALEYLPELDRIWRSTVEMTLGDVYGFKGDMLTAYEARFEALEASKAAGAIYLVMLANVKLAITLRSRGWLHRTIEICQQQIQYAYDCGLSQTPLNGLLLIIWGEVLAELNDLDGAKLQAEKGTELTGRGVDMALLGWGYMCLMRILYSRGDLAGIEQIIQEMEDIDRESNVPPWIRNQMATWQTRVWLSQGKLQAASQWAIERDLSTDSENKPRHEITFFSLVDYLVLARIMIARGQLNAAAGLLSHLLSAAETGSRTSKAIEILALQALLLRMQEKTDQALTTLERALTLAEPEGFVRIFVDEGPPMDRLLREAAARGIMPGYVGKLLAAFGDGTKDEGRTTDSLSVVDRPPSVLVEPLSERELEVLQLIAEGLTNPEIASRLFLALNTVKAHTRNIYGKLGVHSRIQAVARARDLGLLSSP